jgi:hypothetical protein
MLSEFSAAVRRILSREVQTADGLPFAYLRIGTALVLLAKAWCEGHDLLLIYGENALLPWSIADYASFAIYPKLSVMARFLGWTGANSDAAVVILFSAYVLLLISMLLGWSTRFASFGAWFLHLAFVGSGYRSQYGLDCFATIALFYCMVTPTEARLSLDARQRTSKRSCLEIRLWLGLIQAHMCVVYLSAFVAKARGPEWWNGESIWRAVMQPQFHNFVDYSQLAFYPWVAVLMGWLTLIVEGGYALFVWIPWTRRIWLALTLLLHISIGIFLNLYLFSAIMIVLNLSAFGAKDMHGVILRIIAAVNHGWKNRFQMMTRRRSQLPFS